MGSLYTNFNLFFFIGLFMVVRYLQKNGKRKKIVNRDSIGFFIRKQAIREKNNLKENMF